MPPEEQRLRLPSPDRLSNLPIHLIDDILSRLSFRDVVRTSTLSVDWQYTCRRFPEVKFDQTVWETQGDLASPTIGFIPILDCFFMFHIGTTLKVTLDIASLKYEPKELVLEEKYGFDNIFSSIPALEYFSWDHFEVDIGSTEFIPTRLPSVLNCLKRLFISWITLGEFFELSFALCMIRSSPNLEEIEIQGCILNDGNYFESVPQEVVDEIPASFSDITFNNLRTVKFYDVLLEEGEMQLIKVLLANSPALVKLEIKPSQMETDKSLKVLAEITKFQQTSSKAEVVYLVD
ncbi:F-box/FBD/LRR-repeat protein At1g13570-like [Solanum pennellii]|uniref:F-box/FBD/LRR-repeat protein At1g13570-like n=1 Tax=Solanum pennellii TaxID=28526 RepID=A0ABM1GSI8_SOLPN|nr:F-box/FBD/LRR-repeat protein At1g13570-like [Solanum pennellii]